MTDAQLQDRSQRKITMQYGSTATDAPLQDIADRVLRKIALQYGSTTRRDFRVIELVIGEMFGSGTPATQEQADATDRSEAP